MWWRVSTLLALGGCAQVLGLDVTERAPDARPTDAPASDGPAALPCLGGDARSVDPATGACYVLFTAPMTRDAARTACVGLGGGARLASIESAAESALVTTLLGTGEAWLGASDEALEGSFVWENGTALQLTRWNTGEPNSGLGMYEEDCLVVLGALGGVWDDRPCAPPPVNLGMYAAVCERD